MQRVFLLGVPIDAVTQGEAVQRILVMLRSGWQRPASAPPCGATAGKHVMTPNSEMLVEAVRNPAFHTLLRRTALNLSDSSGLLRMARWTGQRLPERVTGVDTVERLCEVLDENCPVFLLGGGGEVGGRAGARLMERNPQLRVVGTYAGSPREEDREEILRRINDAKPHLLFVAFGAPAQDLWIDRYLPRMPSVRVAMGVGGTFDFLAGVRKRAPVFLQRLGMEWAWRLLLEPWRMRRIWNAVVVFPLLVARYGKKITPATSPCAPHSTPPRFF